MSTMDYFNLAQKDDFLRTVGERYNSNSIGTKWFLDTRSKLEKLSQLLAERFNLDLVNNYNEKPNGQAGKGKGFKLKHYILYGIVPKEFKRDAGKNVFIKLIFYEKAGQLHFAIECDTNFSIASNKYNQYRETLINNTHKSWLVNDDFPDNYSDLLDLIAEQFQKNVEFFQNFMTQENKYTNDKISNSSKKNKLPKNQILFGPPGTGKTYSTVKRAIEIVDPKYLKTERSRKELADHFRSLLFDEKKNPNGQIVFTTFHQSLAYEDFIEGIKPNIADDIEDDQNAESESAQPDIDYIVKDGIFKQVVDLAKKSTKSTVEFESLWSDYLNQLRSINGEKLFYSVNSELKLDSIPSNENAVHVRYKNSWNPNEPQGTRAFIVSKNMIERLFDAKVDGSDANKRGRTDVAKYVGSGRATHIYSVYRDFYDFALSKGAFSQGQRLDYVIIIDEINRGNVSSIFGELITLIEEDKRLGEINELTAVLPYSRDKFGVPSNLHIIGTMNTADRSVEALDTALRRRFSFTEMPPRYDLKGLQYEYAGVRGSDILRTINKRIQKLLNRDHLIGHSYFLIGEDEEPETKLMDSFYRNIIPLLQEYFYGDYAKIGAVLGQGFIYSEEEGEEAVFGAGYEDVDYNEKEEYLIRDYRESARIRTSIDGTETELTFERAIKMLLNIE